MKIRKYVNKKNFVALMLVFSMLAPQLSATGGVNFATVDRNTSVDQVIKTKGAQVDVAYLNQLDDADLIKLLSKMNHYDIKGLGSYSEATKEFYMNDHRRQLLIDEIAKRATKITAEDNQNIPTFIEVLRLAYYHGFYQPDMKKLSLRSEKLKCLPAIKAIVNNQYFGLGTKVQNELVATTGLFVNNAASDIEVVNKLTVLLEDYQNNFETYSKDQTTGKAIFNILSGVAYDIKGTFYENNDYKKSEFYGKVDHLIDVIGTFAFMQDYKEEDQWLAESGVYYAADLGKFHSDEKSVLALLCKALDKSAYLGVTYLTAAEKIHTVFNDELSNGSKLPYEQIMKEAKNKYYGKTHVFDNGEIVIKAGDRVADEKIQKLYWATKEVRSQFHRAIGTDQALEPDNADKVLTIIIYNDKKEYEMNRLINGIGTDNGGMYIEGSGTFYTWDRVVPKDSIFELEELFRHEFTHYLQGRYIVPGMWGNSEIYKNNRLTWFEEGGAEFFAGSTRLEGVQPRKTIYSKLSYYDQEDYYSLEKTLNSGYSDGWDFYNFSSAYIDYMYNYNFDLFKEFTTIIQSNDVAKLDALKTRLAKDMESNATYKAHTAKLAKESNQMTVPFVSKDYEIAHADYVFENVANTIGKTFGIKEMKVKAYQSDYFNTYTSKFHYTIKDDAINANTAWQIMNTKLNDQLKTLSKEEWTGFDTVTGYFTNLTVNKSGKLECDVTLSGVLTDARAVQTYQNEVALKVDSSVVIDPKPDTPGEDNDPNAKLSESRNSFNDADAKGLSYGNEKYTAAMVKQDMSDYFAFEVTKKGKVAIDMNELTKAGNLNFLVYSEKDQQNYMGYATVEGGKLTFDKELETGKYYILAYRFSGDATKYDFVIKGDTVKTANQQPDNGTPVAGNDANTAIAIGNQQKIKGSVNKDFMTCYYALNSNQAGKVSINLKSDKSQAELNYVVVHESNLSEYVDYAKPNKDGLASEFDAKQGKYYIIVYSYGQEPVNYEIEVNM